MAVGLGPVKVNMVVKRGLNDSHIEQMAEHFRGTGCTLRFIEYMDVGTTNGWRLDEVLPARTILDRVSARWPLEPVKSQDRAAVAQRHRYRDGAGELGVISSVTQPFCGDCNRARLTADGQLYTCLFASKGHDLRRLLREGQSDADVAAFIESVWRARDDRYSELRTAASPSLAKVEMSRIGG